MTVTGTIGSQKVAVEWAEDEDPHATGTYVVVGIEDDDDGFSLTPAYGPFPDFDSASEYGMRNFSFSWVCEVVNVEGSYTHMSVTGTFIHPNQATIGDYIDPSVVE